MRGILRLRFPAHPACVDYLAGFPRGTGVVTAEREGDRVMTGFRVGTESLDFRADEIRISGRNPISYFRSRRSMTSAVNASSMGMKEFKPTPTPSGMMRNPLTESPTTMPELSRRGPPLLPR